MVIYGRNFQKKIDSLQGTVVSVLQKSKKRGEIRLFSTGRTTIRKMGPKAVTAKITLNNNKEISVDFKVGEEMDFDSISKRLKNIINPGN